MKHLYSVDKCVLMLLACVLLQAATVAPLLAQAETKTGFYYPIGTSSWNHEAGSWLGRDKAHGGNYFDGKYHIGEDMMAPYGSKIYAISSGDVVQIWTTDANDNDFIGPGNSVIFIKHTLQDGSQFLAEYMHVHPTVQQWDHVSAGQVIATVGAWYYDTHLHFGIHPGLSVPTNHWGAMDNSQWAAANGFVDPVNWITTNSPSGSSSLLSTTPPSVSFNEGNKNRWFGPNNINTQIVAWNLNNTGGGLGGFSQWWDSHDPGGGSPQFPNSTSGWLSFGSLPSASQQGMHTTYVRTYNSNHSQSQVSSSGWYGYDALPPTVTLTNDPGQGKIVPSGSWVAWNISDPDSGVSYWTQAWDNQTPQQYSTSSGYLYVPTTGIHTLHVHAWDNVGNNKDWTFGPYQVQPPTPALASITLIPNTVTAGNTSTATINLTNPAQAGGFRVNFPLDGPYAYIVEDHITIPQGATSATVQVLTDYHITSQYVSQIKATAGTTTVQATLTVNPAPVQVTAIQINPSSVVGGHTVTATIFLSHPSLSGGTTTVYLTPSNRSVASLGTLATVPAGAAQTTVTVYTYAVKTSTAATIWAYAIEPAPVPEITVSTSFTVNPK